MFSYPCGPFPYVLAPKRLPPGTCEIFREICSEKSPLFSQHTNLGKHTRPETRALDLSRNSTAFSLGRLFPLQSGFCAFGPASALSLARYPTNFWDPETRTDSTASLLDKKTRVPSGFDLLSQRRRLIRLLDQADR